MTSTNLSDFSKALSLRLLLWSGLSIVAGGLLLLLSPGELAYGLGIMALAWGGIDALIAFIGRIGERRSSGKSDTEIRNKSRKLQRALWINTGLDVVYITAGIILAVLFGGKSMLMKGLGLGVIIQGGFLLFFDLFHAKAVPPGPPMVSLNGFSGSEHRPFHVKNGRNAALLVHGFPGTPAEMRPLGEKLSGAGWSVSGILLSGFGREADTLFDRRHDEWIEDVKREYRKLESEYEKVVVIGYSFGASVSLAAAQELKPAGLILIAPFWRFGSAVHSATGTLLSPFLPRYFRPFKLFDPADPGIAHSVSSFFPELDMNDPGAADQLRELKIPISLIGELLKTGKKAYRAAPDSFVPVAVIQGKNDATALESNTEELIRRFPERSPAEYTRVESGHDLIRPEDPGWENVSAAALAFCSRVGG